MNFKKFLCIISAISIILMFTGCTDDQDTDSQSSADNTTTVQLEADSDMFTANDIEIGYDETQAVSIILSDTGSTVSESGVTVSDSTVTITKEGTYILSGSLSDGTVIIDSTNTSKIRLILDEVNVSSSSTAPIYIKQADKVFITTANGTENTLNVTGEYVNSGEDNIDAAIFSKDDLTLNGTGTLTINADYGHGIVSKDDLVFTGGTYNITSASHAVTGKDSVRISDGTYSLIAGKDGIHAENTDDTSLGFIYIENGAFAINANGDGIDSSNCITVFDGSFNILAGGGSENGETHYESMNPFGNSQNSSSEDTVSTKAIKSSGDIAIGGGMFNLDSADDAIHSNANVNIYGGTFTIASGDDGIHADSTTSVTAGKINITYSYEGIEGQAIEISGGDITLYATDDGMNAAGGNDSSGFGGRMGEDNFSGSSDSYIIISGGKLLINADGDGVDSNGDLTVSGGETYVAGPTNSGNGAIDYGDNGTAKITGGIFVATGASGMAENFGSASTQCAIMTNTSTAQTGDVTLTDTDGNVLVTFSPEKSYNNVVISCPEIKSNGNYTLTAGTSSKRISMSGTLYGSGSSMGMGSGNMGGPGGNMGGGKHDRW